MNVLSLFDGKSCGQVTLERMGIKVDNYFASEIEPSAIAIAQKNYPNTIQLGDVTKWKEWDLPRIDLIIGGSPCQGFSRAGKQLNFEDPRSKLFFEFVNIRNHIRENNNPDVKFMLENVKMRNEWRDIMTDYMEVPFIEINSKVLSAQNRPRMYWTNLDVEPIEDAGIRLLDILEDPDMDKMEYDEEKELFFEKSISEESRNLVSRVNGEIRVSQTTNLGYKVAHDGDGINISFPTSKSRRGRVIEGKSSTIDTACNICVLQGNVIRRFTITELERLQTLPDGYTAGTDEIKITDGQRKHAIGNGWTIDVIAHVLKGLKKPKEKVQELRNPKAELLLYIDELEKVVKTARNLINQLN